MMIYKLLKKVQVLTLTLLVLVSYSPISASTPRSSKKILRKSKRSKQSKKSRISVISNRVNSNRNHSNSTSSSRSSSVSTTDQSVTITRNYLGERIDKFDEIKNYVIKEKDLEELFKIKKKHNIFIGNIKKREEISLEKLHQKLEWQTIGGSGEFKKDFKPWLNEQLTKALATYINKQAPDFTKLVKEGKITRQDINNHFSEAIKDQEDTEQEEPVSGSEDIVSMDKLCENILPDRLYDYNKAVDIFSSIDGKDFVKQKHVQKEKDNLQDFIKDLKQKCDSNNAFITRMEKGQYFLKEQVAEVFKALNIAEQPGQDLTTDQLWKKLYNNKYIALQNPAALNKVMQEINDKKLKQDKQAEIEEKLQEVTTQAEIDKISNQHASSKQKLENERKRLSAENKKAATDLVNAQAQADVSKFDNHKKLIIIASIVIASLSLFYHLQDYIVRFLVGEKHPDIKTSIQKGIFASSAKRKHLPDRGKDLILAPRDRKELQNIYDTLKQRKKNKQVAMHHKLIAGQPGNGKTTIAQSIIAKGHNECNFDYICLDARQLARRNQKEQIAVLDNALITAKKHPRPVILFIDEVEALFPKRGTSEHLTNIVSVLLTHVQETFDKSFMIIAITNYPDILDAAVSDRLEFWKIDPPNRERCCKIFNGYVEKFIVKKGISIQAPVSLEDKKGQAFIKSLRDVSPRTIKGAVVKTATNLLIKKTKGPIDVIEEVGKVLKLQEKKENPIKKSFRKLTSRFRRRR